MAVIESWYNQDLTNPVQVQYIHGNVFSLDNGGNLIGVNVFDSGEPATLSGTVSASVIRSDGGTVAVAGTLSGNQCYVVLPQAAYAVPGVVSIVIKLTSGATVTTLCAVVANVYRSSTDTVVDPGTIIPDISALIASIEAAVSSIPADYSSLWTSLAPTFDSTKNYVAGKYVTYDGGLYLFTVAHSGSWSASDVIRVNIGGELFIANSEIEYIEPIVAPVKTFPHIENGTIVNPGNANAVRTANPIKCKQHDIVKLYPVRPNTSGYHYVYGYRIYDASGNTVRNVGDAIENGNVVGITEANADSIRFFWFEYNGTQYNPLRYDTYGYSPYVTITNGESTKEQLEIAKKEIEYISPYIAPVRNYISSLTNGTITNANNVNAVTLTNAVKCKQGDTVTIYPVRPNRDGYYYQYTYRVYDANGNSVMNDGTASASNNSIRITSASAASIKFSIFEYNGSSYSPLRFETYGYTPYVVAEDGTSFAENVTTFDNLYTKYGGMFGTYYFNYSSLSEGTIESAGSVFSAFMPCAPNTKYKVKLTSPVTSTQRFRIAWCSEYPAPGVSIYDILQDDSKLEGEYTTGKAAMYLIVSLGATLTTETPAANIIIQSKYYGVDAYSREFIYAEHDKWRQSAAVLRLKKTTSEQYGACDAKFMFATDIHKEEMRLKDAVNRCNEWGTTYIDAFLNGGDTVKTVITESLDWYYDVMETSSVPYLNTVGNHDAWATLSTLEQDPTVVYNKIIAPTVSEGNFVQPSNAAANGYNYYYKDFSNTVRLIVLDCMYWNTAQLTWFEGVLSDAKTNELHVLCMTHASFPWTYMQSVDCLWAKSSIPEFYSDSGALSDPTRTNIEAAQAVKDFIDGGGQFICWITGHQHGDDLHILPDYGNQYVVTMGSFAQRASMLQKSDIPTNYNYNCLTYITVDATNKAIRFFRVGADIDMYGVKHDGLCINYGNNTLISAW